MNAGGKDRSQKTRDVARALVDCYGMKRWKSHGDPLSELVATILSQNTSDANSSRAFSELKRRFPTWADVISAPTSEVAEAIRSGGLADIKAPRIQEAVKLTLLAYPDGDFCAIASFTVAEARSALTAIPGIGPKTASCVLLFSLGIPAMPVDTHVHRVAMRTGIIDSSTTAEKAHAILESRLGDDLDTMYSFHMNAIQHGRQVCKARYPLCDGCCLNNACDYFQKRNND
jgi:endonuclease III